MPSPSSLPPQTAPASPSKAEGDEAIDANHPGHELGKVVAGRHLTRLVPAWLSVQAFHLDGANSNRSSTLINCAAEPNRARPRGSSAHRRSLPNRRRMRSGIREHAAQREAPHTDDTGDQNPDCENQCCQPSSIFHCGRVAAKSSWNCCNKTEIMGQITPAVVEPDLCHNFRRSAMVPSSSLQPFFAGFARGPMSASGGSCSGTFSSRRKRASSASSCFRVSD
jgi:hypothetical protein